MFERFSRSWSLTRASWAVLKQDTQLLAFPLVSALATVLVAAAFALGAVGLWSIDGLTQVRDGGHVSPAMFCFGVLFYVSSYFVIFFCNTALVGAAMIRFDGGEPTVAAGWQVARSRAGSLLGYAIIAATVGMVLRAIQERVGFLGRIVVGLLGVGWTVATAMVVPILVHRDVGPVEAVRESASMLKKTWGENVIGQGGLSVAFGLLYVAAALGAAALCVGAAMAGSVALIVLAVAASVAALLALALAHSALSGIYSAALYRYATTGAAGAGFDPDVLQQAFARKKK